MVYSIVSYRIDEQARGFGSGKKIEREQPSREKMIQAQSNNPHRLDRTGPDLDLGACLHGRQIGETPKMHETCSTFWSQLGRIKCSIWWEWHQSDEMDPA